MLRKSEKRERRISPKKYAIQKELHISSVYKRIEAGTLRAEQDAKGQRVMIILEEPFSKISN
jgi:hypothetical protein